MISSPFLYVFAKMKRLLVQNMIYKLTFYEGKTNILWGNASRII